MNEVNSERSARREDGRPAKGLHELTWREQISGLRPGDRALRIARHRHFRSIGTGVLEPRREAIEPKGGLPRVWWRIKRFLIGRPIPSVHEVHERLSNVKALAVFSSDALSSVAYAPEALMRTLILAGIAALSLTMPIAVVIALLLAIVASSYQQTIRAYPRGGGSYIVASDNLGTLPGLVAASMLLIDYILTVSVSVAAGVDALRSAFPALRPFDLDLAIGAVVLIMLINLRGIRESGSIFAVPTYVFVVSVLALIALGLVRWLTGGIAYTPGLTGPLAGIQPLTWFLILSAFAKGCAALTGTEAISDGVPAFKPPESRNARITLIYMAVLLGAMFLGISFLFIQIGLVPDPSEHETMLSQFTRLIAGDSWFYYLVQFATALILLLAANTSYSDFPRLLSFLARDRFVPRWFALRGDRLAFSVGIFTLSILSGLLLIIFGASVDRLLPLYALGVFTAFTLSQSGMVVHWLRSREPGRKGKVAVNGLGACMTAVVTVVIASTKFMEGAWIVMLIAPAFVVVFLLVNEHYRSLARQLRANQPVRPKGAAPVVLVPVPSLSRVARDALAFAQDLSRRVVAVHVATDRAEAERLRAEWPSAVGEDVQLVIIDSPYRLLVPPLIAYVEALREIAPDDTLLVVLPEFVPKHWWEHVLHNQTALRLKAALLYEPGVVVASFPYQLSE